MPSFRKVSARRSQVRKNIAGERFARISRLADIDIVISIVLWLAFVIACCFILCFDLIGRRDYRQAISLAVIVVLISLAAKFYIYHYQNRIIKNHIRALALAGLFILLLGTVKIGL